MTKKFWNDWQKRVGETINIYIYIYWNGLKIRRHSGILHELNDDKLIKATFHEDTVDLIIERHYPTLNNIVHIENEYKTLHREDIATIKFKKYAYDI